MNKAVNEATIWVIVTVWRCCTARESILRTYRLKKVVLVRQSCHIAPTLISPMVSEFVEIGLDTSTPCINQ